MVKVEILTPRLEFMKLGAEERLGGRAGGFRIDSAAPRGQSKAA